MSSITHTASEGVIRHMLGNSAQQNAKNNVDKPGLGDLFSGKCVTWIVSNFEVSEKAARGAVDALMHAVFKVAKLGVDVLLSPMIGFSPLIHDAQAVFKYSGYTIEGVVGIFSTQAMEFLDGVFGNDAAGANPLKAKLA